MCSVRMGLYLRNLFFLKKEYVCNNNLFFFYNYLNSNQLLKLQVANCIKLNYSHQKSKVISELNLFYSFNNFLTHLFLLLNLMLVALPNEAKIFVHSKRDRGLYMDYLTVK